MLPSTFGVCWPFSSGEEGKNRFSWWRPSWISDRPFGSGEEAKNRFSRWRPWQPSWIFDRHDFSYFWSTSHPRCFLATLESIGLSVQERKRKIDFQDGGHLGFPIGTILAIFDLQVTPMLPSKFGVKWPFSSGEEAKNRFSRWRPLRPSWISDRHDFRYFWSTSHLDASLQVSSQLAQGCRRRRLLKQLLTPHDGWCMTDNGHWLTTIAHHEHFMLRWANNSKPINFYTGWKTSTASEANKKICTSYIEKKGKRKKVQPRDIRICPISPLTWANRVDKLFSITILQKQFANYLQLQVERLSLFIIS